MGHVARMPDERPVNALLYGILGEGSRRVGRPLLRYKDTLKDILSVCLSVCLSVFYLIEQVKFFFWQLLADVDLLYFHRGQPQHRELHALLFSNNVWVL